MLKTMLKSLFIWVLFWWFIVFISDFQPSDDLAIICYQIGAAFQVAGFFVASLFLDRYLKKVSLIVGGYLGKTDSKRVIEVKKNG
jgi:hypothetical protein